MESVCLDECAKMIEKDVQANVGQHILLRILAANHGAQLWRSFAPYLQCDPDEGLTNVNSHVRDLFLRNKDAIR